MKKSNFRKPTNEEETLIIKLLVLKDKYMDNLSREKLPKNLIFESALDKETFEREWLNQPATSPDDEIDSYEFYKSTHEFLISERTEGTFWVMEIYNEGADIGTSNPEKIDWTDLIFPTIDLFETNLEFTTYSNNEINFEINR